MKHTTLFPRTLQEWKQWHARAERCKHTQDEAFNHLISGSCGCVCLLCVSRNKRVGFGWWSVLYIWPRTKELCVFYTKTYNTQIMIMKYITHHISFCPQNCKENEQIHSNYSKRKNLARIRLLMSFTLLATNSYKTFIFMVKTTITWFRFGNNLCHSYSRWQHCWPSYSSLLC